MARQPTSAAARAERGVDERGFALIEILCVLAIIGMLAAIILPALPRATTRAKLESYAVQTAALLKADRNTALRRQIQVTTQIDAASRSIRSGVTGRVIRLPRDVSVDATLAARCADRIAGRSIDFFPSGMSCGGTIAMARPGMGYRGSRQLADRRRRYCPAESCSDAGFTLIEALVALAIVAAVLGSIGAVIATTVKGTRSIDQRVALAGTAGALLAALPARNLLKPGRQSGETAGHRWRIDVSPMQIPDVSRCAADPAFRPARRQHAGAGARRPVDAGHDGAPCAPGRRMSAVPRRKPADEAGFTLIEVLLATLLMTVILGALATVTAQWLPNWNRGMARVQRAERLAIGLERIAADLSVAEMMPINGDARTPLFEGSELSVTFVRTAVGPNARPGLEIVRFIEKADDRGLAMVRERAPFTPMPADAQIRFADQVVLVRAPFRVTFSYAGPDQVWQPELARTKTVAGHGPPCGA